MVAIRLTRVGESVALELPEAFVDRFGLRAGDTLYAQETKGGLSLSVRDPEFEAQMAVARRLMKERHAILRALADGQLPAKD